MEGLAQVRDILGTTLSDVLSGTWWLLRWTCRLYLQAVIFACVVNVIMDTWSMMERSIRMARLQAEIAAAIAAAQQDRIAARRQG